MRIGLASPAILNIYCVSNWAEIAFAPSLVGFLLSRDTAGLTRLMLADLRWDLTSCARDWAKLCHHRSPFANRNHSENFLLLSSICLHWLAKGVHVSSSRTAGLGLLWWLLKASCSSKPVSTAHSQLISGKAVSSPELMPLIHESPVNGFYVYQIPKAAWDLQYPLVWSSLGKVCTPCESCFRLFGLLREA